MQKHLLDVATNAWLPVSPQKLTDLLWNGFQNHSTQQGIQKVEEFYFSKPGKNKPNSY